MEELLKFIIEEALVMVPVLLVLGYIIKQSNKIVDNFIPIMLLVFSVAFTPLLLGGYTPDHIVQGILVTGASVLTHQVYKQTQELRGK